MTSIGEELKRERELRGISLKEIANATKINMRFLRALEEDQLNMLPGKFFTRSIIRTYAQYIGLEEDAALNKYYETVHHPVTAQEGKEGTLGPQMALSHTFKRRVIVSVLFLLLLAILSSFYFFLGKKEKPTPIQVQSPPSQIQEEEIIPPSVVVLPEEEKELDMEMSFHALTWIQVYADGDLKVDGLKHSGENVQVTAQDKLLIHLGNAGGFTYTLNDKKGKPLGSSGQVVKNIQITLKNYHQFLEQKQEDSPQPDPSME